MNQDARKTTRIEHIREHFSKPRKAIRAIREIKGYADIQHFYKSRLQYMQSTDKENEQNFVLGYN